MAGKYYLGFDFSTQQIKAIAVDDDLKVVFEDHVKFDTDLPEFGTHGGACIQEDQVTVTAPTAMWVKALDILLNNMKNSGFDFSKVVTLSGDGQQHGSVYWKHGAQKTLLSLQSSSSLFEQLKDSFSVKDSPIWQDASTGHQIEQLQTAVGGASELARLTGSRGFERFTGEQIMKIFQTNREAFDNTERISLISSFAASLFLGDYAPIDYGDGSGMNLLDIRDKHWVKTCLEACGPGLGDKLGNPVPGDTVVGNVSGYMCSKYGFPADCKVVAFTGDNMSSLAGLAPRKGDVMVSLGSSDTVFLWLPEATPGTDGHIFINPLEQNTFMGLVCFKNGSLTRERVMQECAGSWEKFNDMLKKSPPGNNGNIGIYFDQTEIQPVVMGTFRFNEKDEPVESFPPEVEVRAVLEGQFLARFMYAKSCGLQIDPKSRVIATGGASANPAILQVIADIFNAAVYVTDVPNSAGLGGCYRAKHAIMQPGTSFEEIVKGLPEPVCACKPTPGIEKNLLCNAQNITPGTSFEEIVKGLPEPVCACKPTPGIEKVYALLLERYRKLEGKIATM